jgi:hypothetical protein
LYSCKYIFLGDINSESESQTGNSGSEDNVGTILKDNSKNLSVSSHNGTGLPNFSSLNGGLDRPLSPSKELKLNRNPSFKKSANKKVRHR